MQVRSDILKTTFIAIFVCVAGCENRQITSLSCPLGSHPATWSDHVPGVTIPLVAQGCRDSENKRHGWHVAWQAPGAKHHEGYFEHGVFAGEWAYYHNNGRLSSRGFFVNGKRDGWWDHWGEDGHFIYSLKYADGVTVEEENASNK